MARTTKQFEGFEELPYYDTAGKLTSGYGFNVDDPTVSKLLPQDYLKAISGDITKSPIMTKQMAEPVFSQLSASAQKDAKKYLGKTYDTLPEDAKFVLDDLSYNLGATKLKKFQGLKKALIAGDYDRAAEELRYSNADTKKKETPYYKQTKSRAKEHYQTLKNIKNKLLEAEMLRQMGAVNE